MLEFIDSFKSAVIGTVDGENMPFSSYAPYLYHDHRFYIFISDIATHAKNLKANSKASLLFIEDESVTANVFARKRISLQCGSEPVQRESMLFETVMTRFQERFEMIGMLRQMADFNLYALKVVSGEATFGFGEAYRAGGEHMETLLPRKGGTGHRKT